MSYEPDALDITPEMMLQEALRDIQQNKILDEDDQPAGPPPKALLILLYDEHQNSYGTRFYNSGMKVSEMIALLTVMQCRMTNIVCGK